MTVAQSHHARRKMFSKGSLDLEVQPAVMPILELVVLSFIIMEWKARAARAAAVSAAVG